MRQPLVDATGRAIGPAPLPPDVRRGIRRVFGTRGVPSVLHGNDGDLATDPTTGKVYVKTGNAWQFKTQGFNRLFAPGSGDVFSIANGDPLDLAGASYDLHVVSSDGNGTVLGWTYPSLAYVNLHPNGVNGPIYIYLQRSPSQVNHRLEFLGHPLQYQDEVGATANWQPSDGSPNDGNWTAIQSWTIAQAASWADPLLPVGYTDPTVPDHIFNYRIVLYIHSGVGQAYGEVDWNIATATKHYNVIVSQQADGAHISWT